MTSPISASPGSGEILKQDQRGRIRTPLAQREALVDEFEHSSLSGVKFAAMAGVKYATFANWVQKRRKARLAGSVGSPSAEVATSPVRTGREYERMRLSFAAEMVGLWGSRGQYEGLGVRS